MAGEVPNLPGGLRASGAEMSLKLLNREMASLLRLSILIMEIPDSCRLTPAFFNGSTALALACGGGDFFLLAFDLHLFFLRAWRANRLAFSCSQSSSKSESKSESVPSDESFEESLPSARILATFFLPASAPPPPPTTPPCVAMYSSSCCRYSSKVNSPPAALPLFSSDPMDMKPLWVRSGTSGRVRCVPEMLRLGGLRGAESCSFFLGLDGNSLLLSSRPLALLGLRPPRRVLAVGRLACPSVRRGRLMLGAFCIIMRGCRLMLPRRLMP
mmetsp:Transcript_3932/g.9974  ORF Transcript_3932/g.9974 Transcript_3932/m.9974 type:complete len:271 (-) Transcript_3932:613-1425(-)